MVYAGGALTVVVGAIVALLVDPWWIGAAVAALSLVDLLIVPPLFERSARTRMRQAIESGEATRAAPADTADAAAGTDPSYNPYARED
jgi:membrane protein implicated in regulation of membrane protease activity